MSIRCPTCNSKTAVIDSRTTADNIQRRRHRCLDNNHSFSTMEVIVPARGKRFVMDRTFQHILLQSVDTYLRGRVTKKRLPIDE